jgi:hypothetical protein
MVCLLMNVWLEANEVGDAFPDGKGSIIGASEDKSQKIYE